MRIVVILVLSAMAGAVAAAFVWFGWDLCENVFAIFIERRRAKAAPKNTNEEREAKPPAVEGS
ncbi:MAG TPA: hypothetical protein HPP83_05030 [Candidatus Hydrogenedentes bacterium]|nr:hypothetical protein [Candidatus Hydrogenedentota bacterium]